MKKVFKKIIISISIIYIILSIGYIIFNGITYKEELNGMYPSNQNTEEYHEETINLPNNLTLQKMFRTNYITGKYSIISDFNIIFIISIILGIITGLTFFIKENTKIKYVLSFILFNSIYNILIASLIIIYQNSSINFFDLYFSIFKQTFIINIIFYILFIIIGTIDKKIKVKDLNKNLEQTINK